MTMTTLERQAFETSRELEYFTDAELRAQIEYAQAYWTKPWPNCCKAIAV